jgi:Rft protein
VLTRHCGRLQVPQTDRVGLASLAHCLSLLAQTVSLLGLTAVAFGPPYAYLAIRLLYSTTWCDSEAPTVLSAFTLYILLLAVNGETCTLFVAGPATANWGRETAFTSMYRTLIFTA